MTEPYEDIIHLPHHTSPLRTPMSAHDRAAQFSPFAALTGYGDAITETGRLTDRKVEMDEYVKMDLDGKLSIIQERMNEQMKVLITYFRPDRTKSGGAYVTTTGCVKKLDEFRRMLVMQDGTKIPMDDILEIDGERFDTL